MPELPEVETTKRGIEPHITNKRVEEVIIRQKRLRWDVPNILSAELTGHSITTVARRGKYLLLESAKGTLLMHLGMSGSLRIVDSELVAGKHDHVDIVFDNGKALRFTDPRRFGCLLWEQDTIDSHPLIANLGLEPLSVDFDAAYLYKVSRGRSAAIKTFVMNSKGVVGVGNIYASESLFKAKIHPQTPSMHLNKPQIIALTKAIKNILRRAVQKGGTTINDYLGSGEGGRSVSYTHLTLPTNREV